ncbi:hypothetical protein EJ04DRAFT_588853, partial [Polyplosphaeria fusca]
VSIQVVWSVVLSNGTAYLLSLGMPGYVTAITWMAGPLCGAFVQPYMGSLSDHCGSKYGRRRPFIVLGTAGVLSSIVSLACLELLISSLGLLKEDVEAQRYTTCTVAFLLVWSLSFWIQPLQVGVRALMVDLFCENQQSRVSACASYWVGCGNLIGAASGFLALPEAFGLNGWTQFQCLCLVTAVALSSTVAVGCYLSQEIPALLEMTTQRNAHSKKPRSFEHVHSTYRQLTTVMRQVMVMQFLSWMAWFPFLYYGTSYISSLCMYSGFLAHRDLLSDASLSYYAVRHVANRFGTMGFFCLSCSMLITSISLHACSFQKRRDITNIWTASQILYAFALLSTLFITTWRPSLIFTFYVGISFSVTQFAPFVILGKECASTRNLDGSRPRTGTIMALHNAAISSAQIISAGICAFVLMLSSKWGREDGVVFVISLGAIPALAAAWQSRRLQ